MNADGILAVAQREGVNLSEPSENVLRVEGEPSEELLDLLKAPQIGVLAELWRRLHWGPDWISNWREHCRREWAEHKVPSVRSDPREDLQADHGVWWCLLQVAEGDALGVLHGVRCLGAALERDGERWQLRRGEIEEEEYQALREQFLLPGKVGILAALDELSVYRRWHAMLNGADWRPILQPDDMPTCEYPRLWFEGKDVAICSII